MDQLDEQDKEEKSLSRKTQRDRWIELAKIGTTLLDVVSRFMDRRP